VNLLLGDVIKVTPSSKVVGDLAIFLVKNDLQPEDVYTKKDLAFPESVVGLLKGNLGQPHGGWPAGLQEAVLKGEQPITCRPGELLEPADLEAERRKAEERVGHPVDDRALASFLLYPGVFVEFDRHRQEYSDTSVIPTPQFFYGLAPGQEAAIDIEAGKTLFVKLVTVGPVQKDGTREVYFELNGEGRTVTVRDQSVAKDEAARAKADKANPKHVGAPMPGKILKLAVKAGDAVKAGQVLLVTEAMKMETNVKARVDGTVAEVKLAEGAKVEKEDLLVVLG
jgi:pyruvate carboxylase